MNSRHRNLCSSTAGTALSATCSHAPPAKYTSRSSHWNVVRISVERILDLSYRSMHHANHAMNYISDHLYAQLILVDSEGTINQPRLSTCSLVYTIIIYHSIRGVIKLGPIWPPCTRRPLGLIRDRAPTSLKLSLSVTDCPRKKFIFCLRAITI